MLSLATLNYRDGTVQVTESVVSQPVLCMYREVLFVGSGTVSN